MINFMRFKGKGYEILPLLSLTSMLYSLNQIRVMNILKTAVVIPIHPAMLKMSIFTNE